MTPLIDVVLAFLTTFVRSLARKRDAWTLLGAWSMGWYALSLAAPVGIIDATASEQNALYQVVFMSALAGGCASLYFLEAFRTLLPRLPIARRVLTIALSQLAASVLAFVAAWFAGGHPFTELGNGWISALWLLAVSLLVGTTVACSPAVRGVGAWIYGLALVALTCTLPPPTYLASVHGNFELVFALLPILGLSMLLALVVRSAGPAR